MLGPVVLPALASSVAFIFHDGRETRSDLLSLRDVSVAFGGSISERRRFRGRKFGWTVCTLSFVGLMTSGNSGESAWLRFRHLAVARQSRGRDSHRPLELYLNAVLVT